MSIAVSFIDAEVAAARLAEARRKESLITYGVGVKAAVAELHADPARRASMPKDMRQEFLLDAGRDAVRERNRVVGPEQVP